MSKLIKVDELEKEIAFAKKAAEWFQKNEKGATFTDGGVEAGAMFAVRWGLGNDCVLVFRIEEGDAPRIYQQIIKVDDVPF